MISRRAVLALAPMVAVMLTAGVGVQLDAAEAAGSCAASDGHALRTSPRPVTARTVALTFDDGPNPATTPQILRILARNRVHATFFVVGDRARTYPDLLQQIDAGGHRIGNHTWSHPMPSRGGAFSTLTAAEVAAQIDRTQRVVVDATGVRPCFFRAPGGSDGAATLRRAASARRLTVVNWTLDPQDWAAPDTPSASFQRRIVARSTGSWSRHPVVLMHDGPDHDYRGNTVASLQRVIDWYKVRGYTFTDPLGRRF